MENLQKIKEILFDEADGIFSRLRDGDYSISQEEENAILSFAKDCNEKLKEGNLPTTEVILALEIVNGLPTYQEEEWTTILAEKVVGQMEKEIDI